MFRRRLLALALLLPLASTACGGGSNDDEGAAADTTVAATETTAPPLDTPDTTAAGSEDTMPAFTIAKPTFRETDARARFVNLYANNGQGTDVDVYWGNSAEYGEKATTVAYGAISEYLPIKIDKDPLLVPADGSTELKVAFYLPGRTDLDSRLMQKDETLEKGLVLTFVIGAAKPFTAMGTLPPRTPASLMVGFDGKLGAAPAGKALLVFNDLGIQGIEGGDFMTPSPQGACSPWSITNDISTGNLGTAYTLDPGSYAVTASDANSDCSVRTEPATVEAAAGDVWLVLAYGTSKTDRRLLATKLTSA